MSVPPVSSQPSQVTRRLEVKVTDLNHRISAVALGILSSAVILAVFPMPGSLVLASIVMLVATSYAIDPNDFISGCPQYGDLERENPVIVVRERSPFFNSFWREVSRGTRVPVGVPYIPVLPIVRELVSPPNRWTHEPVRAVNASRFLRNEVPAMGREFFTPASNVRDPVGRH